MKSKMVWLIVVALLGMKAHAQNIGGEADFTWEVVTGGVNITGFTGSGAVVQIPAAIQGMPVVSIGTGAFMLRNLAVVIIPDTVTSIGPMAFAINNLTSINIPSSVTSIGQMAFADNQLSALIIPHGVTSIGYRAFHGNQLLLVIIPDSVVSIGDDAFGDARLLRPDGVEVLIADFQPDDAPVPPVAVQPPPATAPVHADPPIRLNWFSAELTFWGFGFRYERTINELFSVGARIFYDSNALRYFADRDFFEHMVYTSIGTVLTPRFYPWGFPFYLELGVGLAVYYTPSRLFNPKVYGEIMRPMIAPAIGARFGGRERGFFINPFISLPVVFSANGVNTMWVGGIGLGWAW